MRTDELEGVLEQLAKEGRRPKFIYSVPSFQNPAATLSSAAFAWSSWPAVTSCCCARTTPTGWLLEGEPQRTLYSLDGGDYVIYLGRSRRSSPGIRVELGRGAAGAGEDQARAAADPLHLDADAVLRARVLRRGRWRAYIEDLIEIYWSRRCDVMLEALELPSPRRPSGPVPRAGCSCYAFDYIDTTDLLLAKALRENVAFVPGRAAYVDGRGAHAMRLNFAGLDRGRDPREGHPADRQGRLGPSRALRDDHGRAQHLAGRARRRAGAWRRRRTDATPAGEQRMKVAVLRGGRSLEREVSDALRGAGRGRTRGAGPRGHRGIDPGASW